MALDTMGYVQAIEEFIVKMEKIPELIHPDTQKAMEPLCHILGIARVEAVFYETLDLEEQKWGGKVVFYHGDEADLERCLQFPEQTEEGNMMEYQIFQTKGALDWDDQEKEKIEVFVKMLFTFHGRVRTMQVVEKLTFRDQEFGIYNLAWYKKYISQMIEQGEIGKYAACYFDLRHFSVINQQIGRQRGTMVMGKFIRNLQKKLSNQEIVCRVEGDNFAVLFLKDNLNLVMRYLKGAAVVYDEKEQMTCLLEGLLSCIHGLVREGRTDLDGFFEENAEVSEESLQALAEDMAMVCSVYAMFFKKSFFEGEQEYRFVFTPLEKGGIEEQPKFRLFWQMFLPYILVEYGGGGKALPLESVMLGAKNNSDIATRGMKHFLKVQGLDIPVLLSDIPLRY